MQRWRTRLLLLGTISALGLAIPALGQEAPPESVLPPGFGDPEPQPSVTPTPAPGTVTPAPGTPPGFGDPRATGRPSRAATPGGGAPIPIDPAEIAALEAALNMPPPVEIPEGSRRPVEFVGVLDEANGGLGTGAWGRADGRFLSELMRRLDAPTPSRWGSMLLRRALLTPTAPPPNVNPVDWVAERAWLLLRMGEADAARMLVQAIDVDRFTPKMFAIAVQTALATADPAGLCPLVEPGRETSDEQVWALSDAICAALSGEAGQAGTAIDQLRRRSGADRIDLDLTEKMIGAGANSRRAVTIEWDGVDRLNSWRFGLAAATGMDIPPRLLEGAGAHVRAWHARAPMVPLEQRVAAAQVAASLGVFSSDALVEMHSLLWDETDPGDRAASVGGRLRQAYRGRTLEARMAALRDLWGEGATPVERHARRILTATAAARIPPRAELAAGADDLIASMLTAGYDRQAARWSEVVANMDGEGAARARAMLALASPDQNVEFGTGGIDAFQSADQSEGGYATRLLVAALAGLERIDADTASDYGVDLGGQNRWTAMLGRAAQSGQRGTVALLAGVGMQTAEWRGVPPEYLYHVLRALTRVGLGYEARMIAAEAVARST
jgi:hypothetical protein